MKLLAYFPYVVETSDEYGKNAMNRITNVVRELADLFADTDWITWVLISVLMLAGIVSEATPNLCATALVLLMGFLGIVVTDLANFVWR